jgi:hypothetical protein
LTAAQASADQEDRASFAAKAAEIRAALPQWAQLASGTGPAAARNPSLPTLVGLFILILCFFVVLTSISLRDQTRERSVMASLQQTFSTAEGGAPPSDEPPDKQAKRLLGDLRSRLGAEVPLVSGVTPAVADALVLNLPPDLVFKGDGAELAEGFPQILARSFQALKSGPADYAYEVEVGLSAPQIDDKTVARGTAIAAALRDAGFANDAAMVSLTPGSGAMVALTVRLRPNARLKPDQAP